MEKDGKKEKEDKQDKRQNKRDCLVQQRKPDFPVLGMIMHIRVKSEGIGKKKNETSDEQGREEDR